MKTYINIYVFTRNSLRNSSKKAVQIFFNAFTFQDRIGQCAAKLFLPVLGIELTCIEWLDITCSGN